VRLARTEVRAPVAGVISRRSARLGALTGGSEPLFRIIKDGAIDLDAEAPDDVLSRAKIGMKAQVTLSGTDAPIAGEVRLISSEVDKLTRLGRVRIALPEVAPGRVGAFASAVVDIARRDGVAVPASAVTRGERGRVVQVVQDGKVEVRRVELGLAFRELLELTEGVQPGETVVARAAAFLRAGDVVRPIASAREPAR
jgi:RND family efflux transporter MFP subunit